MERKHGEYGKCLRQDGERSILTGKHRKGWVAPLDGHRFFRPQKGNSIPNLSLYVRGVNTVKDGETVARIGSSNITFIEAHVAQVVANHQITA